MDVNNMNELEQETSTFESNSLTVEDASDSADVNGRKGDTSDLSFGETLIGKISYLMKTRSYRSNDSGVVCALTADLVRTIMAINSLDEYQTTITVHGQPCLLASYNLWVGWKNFIAPQKLDITNDDDERDLIDRKQYKVRSAFSYGGKAYETRVLTPEEFDASQRLMLRKLVRFEHQFEMIERNRVVLTEGIMNATRKDRARSVDQGKIYPIMRDLLFAEAYQVSIDRWLQRWIADATK